jgi:predicted acetyltransferase
MQIVLTPAAIADKPALANLMQLYRYDLSEFTSADVDELGCFDDTQIDTYWMDDDCHPFLIRVDGRLAGFALVDRQSRLHHSFDGYTIADFFVMRRYRRAGVGRAAATQLFDRFPGLWEVASPALNVLGQVFWRGVIDRYTNGRYGEIWLQTDGWRGPVHSFVAPADRPVPSL